MHGPKIYEVGTPIRGANLADKADALRAERPANPELLFPGWGEAPKVLEKLLSSMGPLMAVSDFRDKIDIWYDMPPRWREEFQGLVPSAHQSTIIDTLNRTVADYVPAATISERYAGRAIDAMLVRQITEEIRQMERSLIAMGTPSCMETLRRRLGLFP